MQMYSYKAKIEFKFKNHFHLEHKLKSSHNNNF